MSRRPRVDQLHRRAAATSPRSARAPRARSLGRRSPRCCARRGICHRRSQPTARHNNNNNNNNKTPTAEAQQQQQQQQKAYREAQQQQQQQQQKAYREAQQQHLSILTTTWSARDYYADLAQMTTNLPNDFRRPSATRPTRPTCCAISQTRCTSAG